MKKAILAGVVLFQILFTTQSAQPQRTGRVTGTIYDLSDAVFAGMTVVLRGAGVERKLITNEAGVYTAEVPAGLYEISLDGQGLLPYRRAPFNVKSGRTVMVNAAPAISSIPVGVLHVGPPEDFPEYPPDKPLKYESFGVSDSSSGAGQMLVEYKRKRMRGGPVEYERATASSMYCSFTATESVTT